MPLYSTLHPVRWAGWSHLQQSLSSLFYREKVESRNDLERFGKHEYHAELLRNAESCSRPLYPGLGEALGHNKWLADGCYNFDNTHSVRSMCERDLLRTPSSNLLTWNSHVYQQQRIDRGTNIQASIHGAIPPGTKSEIRGIQDSVG